MWYLRHHARRFFRAIMKPIPIDVARKWYQRTRYLYVCLGATAFAYSFYTFNKHKKDIELFPVFDKSSLHKKLRMKGDPGEVVIANIGFGKPITVERYNNEDYILDYEQRKRNYELQQQLQQTSQPIDKNLA